MTTRHCQAARAVLQRAIDDHVFPGAAWGLLQDGVQAECEGAGRLTYDQGSQAVNCETVYDLASVSKVIATTSLAMLLWQRGQLDLQMRVAELLPEFHTGSKDAARRAITVQMLLAHSSGLPAHRHLYADALVLAAAPGSQAAAAKCAVLAMPLEAKPGSRAEYSDLGFIVLGMLLERISGLDLADMFHKWIAVPLHLDRTSFRASEDTSVAPTTDVNWRKRTLQGEVHDENCALLGGTAGHAGLFSNVPDVLKFAAALLQPEKFGIFTAEAVRVFTERQASPADTSRALGWDTPSAPSQSGTTFSAHSVGHLGFTGTSLWIDFDRDLAVTLLTNRVFTDGGEASKEISTIRPAFHDALLGH